MSDRSVPARLLDLTRLVSRLGHGPLTGVDRVEAAYLAELLRRDVPLFGLVRTAAGFLLLGRGGAQGVADLVAGAPLGKIDLLSRLTNRDALRGQAEASVRRLAIARSVLPGRLLRRLPQGTSYLNVGHANLSDRTLAALHQRCRIAVLLHDTIPLDHPQFSRPGTTDSFRQKVAAVAAHADVVIHTTQTTRLVTEPHLHRAGRIPPGVVAPLGVPLPRPGPLPDGLQPTKPFFITLGTVEPRKNHALLLQIWAALGPEAPPLLVIGGRGWAAPALFDQLGSTAGVRLLSGLPDGAVATLLQGAAALLFPSLAEGFGLPPVEAAALGTPVIASDLPVIRELLGDYPIYLGPTDSYSWLETIKTLSWPHAVNSEQNPLVPPSWKDHFNTVLSLV